MRLEWRNSSNVKIDIWEWGHHRTEHLLFPDNVYAGSVLDRLRTLGMVSSKDRYLVLLALAKKK